MCTCIGEHIPKNRQAHNYFHPSDRIKAHLSTKAFFLILSLAKMFTFAREARKKESHILVTIATCCISRSILKLLSGSTDCPGLGLLLKPRNVPSDFRTNHLGRQFLMYSPKERERERES